MKGLSRKITIIAYLLSLFLCFFTVSLAVSNVLVSLNNVYFITLWYTE